MRRVEFTMQFYNLQFEMQMWPLLPFSFISRSLAMPSYWCPEK